MFGELDFAAMKEAQPEKLFSAWLGLPDVQRNEMDAEFRDIFELSCEKGFRAILDEAEWQFVVLRKDRVTLIFGEKQMMLGATGIVARPLLMSAGKQVGAVGMAVDAELDRATGCVKLEPNKPITVAFLLSDESVAALRVVVQDPTTDADLYRSPTDIPVRLGVLSHEQRSSPHTRRTGRQGEPTVRRQGRSQRPRSEGEGRRQRAGLRPRVSPGQVLRVLGRARD